MIFFEKTVYLQQDNISQTVDEIVEAYKQTLGEKAGDVVKLNLSVEEMLLRFRDTYPTDTPCTIKGRRFFGRTTIDISQQGPGIDVVVLDEDMQTTYDILARLDIYPKYSYTPRRGGVNRVSIPVAQKPKKTSSFVSILAAVVLAIICFFLMGLLPADIETIIVSGIVTPMFTKLITVLTGIATLFVFLAVITGILGIGDTAAFGRIGKKFCLNMGATYLLAALILAAVGILFFGVAAQSAGEQGDVIQEIVTLVLDMIPNNFVQPFVEDNDLQVIVISVFIGAMFLIIGEKIPTLRKVVLDASDLMNLAMMTFMKLLPFIVFLGILNMMYTVSLEDIASVWIAFVAFAVGSLIVVVITAVRASIIAKVPYSVIFKCQIPSLIINLATSSQVSALPEHMICIKEKFGIDEKFADFGIPLGIVVFMPCGAIFMGITAWTLASVSGALFAFDAIIKLLIVSVVVAIAAPPIPGAALAVIPIIFTACGVPVDMMPLAIVIATVVGYLLPAFNGVMIQLQMLISAHKMGKIDKNALPSLMKREKE